MRLSVVLVAFSDNTLLHKKPPTSGPPHRTAHASDRQRMITGGGSGGFNTASAGQREPARVSGRTTVVDRAGGAGAAGWMAAAYDAAQQRGGEASDHRARGSSVQGRDWIPGGEREARGAARVER